MKRIGSLYERITSMVNLEEADRKAQKGKANQYGVIKHNLNREANLLMLQDMLKSKTYKTSKYDVFKVYEPKEREVFRLPYYPDRIVHHAIMNVLEPIFVSSFTADTYSGIKKRGIHLMIDKIKHDLKDVAGTMYYLKFDIKKFYPSVDHDVLKALLRRKFKDKDLLWLLDEIIDSAPGIPIGNYVSTYFANFYLSGLDHWLKEEKKVKHMYRYMDDTAILDSDKARLHRLRVDIENYVHGLKLELKGNWKVAPVDDHGLNIGGYILRHDYVLIRPEIKKRFARLMAKNPNHPGKHSYLGWLKHCNARHLTKKLLNEKL